jgi:hypothetical protein
MPYWIPTEDKQSFPIQPEVRTDEDWISVELFYPRLEGHVNTVEVGMTDIRAADSIQISYDFERDGWVVKQASTFSWDADDTDNDMDWQEVAFIQAWGRKKPNVWELDE